MDGVMRPLLQPVVKDLLSPKKRVGVLISGSGTNLQVRMVLNESLIVLNDNELASDLNGDAGK